MYFMLLALSEDLEYFKHSGFFLGKTQNPIPELRQRHIDKQKSHYDILKLVIRFQSGIFGRC